MLANLYLSLPHIGIGSYYSPMPNARLDRSDDCFGVPASSWEKAKSEIRDILIMKARERAMIPYSDLVDQIHAVSFSAFDNRLFAILGEVSIEEHRRGAPLLSVLVVHKVGDMQPGTGFFEMAKSLGRDTSDVLKTWILEVQHVYQYWNK